MFKRRKPPVSAPKKSFHAVQIACKSKNCSAAMLLKDTVYLSDEAPMLPLPECVQPSQCACRYLHRTDRREEPRRLSDLGLQASPPQNDKRRNGDRRRSSS